MKNIELQNLLKNFPDDWDVVVPDRETVMGILDVKDLKHIEITSIVRDSYAGRFPGVHKIDWDDEKRVKAILLKPENE